MAKTKTFKTESKKLLHLMINSIYTHKEIFLRELISNASDAIDKRHYLSLTDSNVPSSDTYEIDLNIDKENRILTVSDNGIGFTEEELINNLGMIASSGSQAFMEKVDQKELEMIGQFGVGFYSAFMVSQEVEIYTRSPYSETGYRWVSKGEATYQIEPYQKNDIGTTIRLKLRDDDSESEENYSKYLQTYALENLVKKYSDYVRYPIKMLVSEYEKDKETQVLKTLNSMIPIWKRQKADITDQDFTDFYKRQFGDYEEPMKTIHTSVEGLLTYTALLFIPQKPSLDFYTDKYERGLQLYSKGVFIMDKNKDLIPEHFRFVKGLVDSADLSLNISREMLQHDRQLKKIASHIEKKIKSELEKMLKNDRENYVKFYEAYGVNLKYGIYDGFGRNKELLEDLIMFKSSKHDEFITLEEYITRKDESQTAIYYASGKSKAQIMSLPQMDALKEKDYEVLFFHDDIDLFMVQVMNKYHDIPFKSIQQGESDLVDDNAKEALKEKEETHSKLLKSIKKALKDQVKDVRLSGRLKDSPLCLVSGEGLSIEMERILKNMADKPNLKAEQILELNPNHALFKALQSIQEHSPNKIKEYAQVLYYQALLIEGYPIEDPTKFSDLMVNLIIEANNKPQ